MDGCNAHRSDIVGEDMRETMREMMMTITVGMMSCRMVLYLVLMSVMTKAETYVYVHVAYSSFALNDGEKST